MVVYEVTVDVDAPLADAWRAYLPGHVAAILALPGFLGATMVDGGPQASGRYRFWTTYQLRDQAALDAYLSVHAPAMRGDALARFEGALFIQRRSGVVIVPGVVGTTPP